MRTPLTVLAIIALAALATGCNPASEQSGKSTTEQIDKIKKESKETAQDMKDYTFAQKGDFVAEMHDQMAEINRDLDQLMVQVEKSSDTAKAAAKPKLQALRDQAAKLNLHLHEVKTATESTWDSVKAGFQKGYGELKEGFQGARQLIPRVTTQCPPPGRA